MKKALVVLSGGQDSVTCLGLACAKFDVVETISFNYNQKHDVELRAAAEITSEFQVDHKIVDLGFLPELVRTNLIQGRGDVSQAHEDNQNLPSSFVPNRNALFLTLAHAYAQKIGASHIYTGVCQEDYSGYPDCRERFIRTLNKALNLGSETEIEIMTPLMNLTKAATFRIAAELGILDIIIQKTHTCYNGDHTTKHAWGYGCGKCPACNVRSNGWNEYRKTNTLLPNFEDELNDFLSEGQVEAIKETMLLHHDEVARFIKENNQ